MADNGEQYGRQTDPYGDPVGQTNEYGTATGAAYIGTHGLTETPHVIDTETDTHGQQHRRTGSNSSSSSSEDDGEGGRRKKKGITDKIKEKLTVGETTDHQHHQASTTIPTAGTGGYEEEAVGDQQLPATSHEKKGIMEKIEDKLPGGGNY